MKVIQRGNLTVYLNPDEETCEQFEDILFAGVAGFLANDARRREGKDAQSAEAESSDDTLPKK
jgi:hypothetical protein